MSADKSGTPVKFVHYPQAQQTFKPKLIAHDNHWLEDVAYSSDEKAPISAGFYHLKPGTPLEYTYHYPEMKIILEGVVKIKDASGQEVTASKEGCFEFSQGVGDHVLD